MSGRRLFVINCLVFALLAFVLAASWWITLPDAGIAWVAWLATPAAVLLGLWALLMALSVALSK